MRFVDEGRIGRGVFIGLAATAFGAAALSFILNAGASNRPIVSELDKRVIYLSVALGLPVWKLTIEAWRRFHRWSFAYALAAVTAVSLLAYIVVGWEILDQPRIQPGTLSGVGLSCGGREGRLIPPEVLPTDPKQHPIYRCVSPRSYEKWLIAQDPEGARPISVEKLLTGLANLWVIPRALGYGLSATAFFWLYVFGAHWRVETERQ